MSRISSNVATAASLEPPMVELDSLLELSILELSVLDELVGDVDGGSVVVDVAGLVVDVADVAGLVVDDEAEVSVLVVSVEGSPQPASEVAATSARAWCERKVLEEAKRAMRSNGYSRPVHDRYPEVSRCFEAIDLARNAAWTNRHFAQR